MKQNQNILFVIPLAFFCISRSLCARAEQALVYSENIGGHATQINWSVDTKDNQTILVSSRETLNCQTITDDSLRVLRWELKDELTKTDFSVIRDKNLLLLQGTFNGKPIKKNISIDGAAWYQPLSYCLENLTRSNNEKIVFWSINPKTLNIYKMKAQKTGVETIQYANKPVNAQKVKVSLAGPKSAFWHAYYWFRLSDGLFLQYKGVDGPPGTPETNTFLTHANP